MKFRKAERTTHLTPSEGLLGDISETGACLNLSKPPKTGIIFTLELRSKEITVNVQAKIVHVRELKENKFQAGIQFLNVTENIRHKIHEIVDDYGRGVPISARILK